MTKAKMVAAAILLATPAYAAAGGKPSPLRAHPCDAQSGGDHGDRGSPQHRLIAEMVRGTVKFFKAQKGFGFISRDDGQADVFVHISAVERAGLVSLNKGDRVEFELEIDPRGKTAAVNLRPIQ